MARRGSRGARPPFPAKIARIPHNAAMSPAQNLVWSKVVLPSLALFGLAGSLLGIAVGLGLLFRTAATLRFFATMNRWVSTRRSLKALEIPRSIGSPTARKPRWNGLVAGI